METVASFEASRVFDATGIRISSEVALRTRLERKLCETWDGTKTWSFGFCKVCAKPMAQESITVLETTIPVTVCNDCGAMVSEHYSPNARDAGTVITQTPWWDETCPPNYKEVITGKRFPAHCDAAAIKRVADWNYSERKGLVLIGASGIGKTMSLWLKARDLEKAGIKPVFLSAVEFARKLAIAARDLDKAEWLMKANVLIVDDLGKEKLSAAVAPLIWEVIDSRNNHRLPTLISTRFRGSSFVDRFSDPILGEDVRGRIADCSRVIQFGLDSRMTEAK